ncbi:hypothetical protein [Megamonas hypermegale]|uniref:hypothetical protein n=1 Tax=Megamonas hypermegale TaxID=158847 RepID=UPI00195AA995|nr:hypothetical protein [Megamonas hypermegale]MBM6833869.1 hypothetical protein [Megamonas hypermegale]
MKIIIDITPKEIAELLEEIKVQPDKALDIDKIVERMYPFLSTNIFSSTLKSRKKYNRLRYE